jgi:hypothetical protein
LDVSSRQTWLREGFLVTDRSSAARPRSTTGWRELLARVADDVRRIDWEQNQGRAALLCLPAIALILAVALALGRTGEGVVATVGAVSVGFGSFRRLTRFRALPMLMAAFGMAVSAWVGSLTGEANLVCIVAVVAVWGLGFGVVTSLSGSGWWIALQWVIGLLVFGAYPADLREAFGRAGLILAGGFLQTLAIHAVWRWRDKPFDAVPGSGSSPQPGSFPAAIWDCLSPRTDQGQYAWRVAMILSVATAVYRLSDFPNGYWVPMTAAIVVQPGLQETLTRSIAQLAGTLIGAVLVTLLTALLRPGPAVLALFAIGAVWACYTLLRVNYAIYAVAITGYVVCLLALKGLPEPAVALHRAIATLIGGAIALLAHVHPTRLRFGGAAHGNADPG